MTAKTIIVKTARRLQSNEEGQLGPEHRLEGGNLPQQQLPKQSLNPARRNLPRRGARLRNLLPGRWPMETFMVLQQKLLEVRHRLLWCITSKLLCSSKNQAEFNIRQNLLILTTFLGSEIYAEIVGDIFLTENIKYLNWKCSHNNYGCFNIQLWRKRYPYVGV